MILLCAYVRIINFGHLKTELRYSYQPLYYIRYTPQCTYLNGPPQLKSVTDCAPSVWCCFCFKGIYILLYIQFNRPKHQHSHRSMLPSPHNWPKTPIRHCLAAFAVVSLTKAMQELACWHSMHNNLGGIMLFSLWFCECIIYLLHLLISLNNKIFRIYNFITIFFENKLPKFK